MKNVLSLFDGMSCGQIALNQLKIKYNNYYASEIDKYAIQITQKNYPNTIQLGDITKLNKSNLPKDVYLLMGGSPCQGFSNAGKGKAFDDPRSALFWHFVRILKLVKPKYFLLENVVMKQEYQDIITGALGVKPIKINSALVSAQNRVRLYWTNIPNITQPEDKGIVINDILEDNLGETLAVTKMKNGPDRQVGFVGSGNFQANRVCKTDGKSPTVSTSKSSNGFYLTPTQLSKLSLKNIKWKGTKIITHKAGNHQQDIIYSPEGKMGCLSAGTHGSTKHLTKTMVKKKIRRLTPIECERLQTVPDNYTKGVSDTQRYRMLGNGWTVDVIKHILKGI